MTPATIDTREWAALCRATRVFLTGQEAALAASVLRALRAYNRHNLNPSAARSCGVLGFPAEQAEIALLMHLSGATVDEIVHAWNTDSLPDRESVRVLLALQGVSIPAAKAPKPKRRKFLTPTA